MIGPEYRLQTACANCKHVVAVHPCVDPIQWYCGHGAGPRPEDPTLGIKKDETHRTAMERRDAQWDAQAVWEQDKRIEPWGWCARHEEAALGKER